MNPKISSVEHESRYQELVQCTDHRYPEEIRRKWMQMDFEFNMGIEFYPSLFVVFQILPLGARQSAIRMSLYAPPDLSADEEELRDIDLRILDEVNAEDKMICERIQRGVQTHGYQPGPLSEEESGIVDFHQRIREHIPVTQNAVAPPRGELEAYNRGMLGSQTHA
jgi:phenylpropionate dioxygenase-like ring-hydroxylating dioxygenase large terminal subunit